MLIGTAIGLAAAALLLLLGVRFGRPFGVRGLLFGAAAMLALAVLFRLRR